MIESTHVWNKSCLHISVMGHFGYKQFYFILFFYFTFFFFSYFILKDNEEARDKEVT